MQPLIAIIIGLLLITFREAIARFMVQAQNDLWNYKFGDREVQASKFTGLIIGLSLTATPLFWATKGEPGNYVYIGLGILASVVAWRLSSHGKLSKLQQHITVKPSTQPQLGNSPVYIVLIVLAIVTFAALMLGKIFWGWY